MKRFGEVILDLCKARNAVVVSHKENVITIKCDIKYDNVTFYENLAYFKAVCDCYMATIGCTAWIISADTKESIIELGYNC